MRFKSLSVASILQPLAQIPAIMTYSVQLAHCEIAVAVWWMWADHEKACIFDWYCISLPCLLEQPRKWLIRVFCCYCFFSPNPQRHSNLPVREKFYHECGDTWFQCDVGTCLLGCNILGKLGTGQEYGNSSSPFSLRISRQKQTKQTPKIGTPLGVARRCTNHRLA